MTITIYLQSGAVAATSKNLRGIVTYSRKHPVETVALGHAPDGAGVLHITWANGAHATADFASFMVMCECVAKRPHMVRSLVYP